MRLYCEVIQPLSLGVEWWNKSHSTGSLSLLCLHFAAAALVQSASACMTFIVLLIGELHLLIIKRNIYRIAHAHLFFFFFFAFVCLCVCMYVSRQALNQANSSPSRCHGYLAVRLGVMATRQQTNHSTLPTASDCCLQGQPRWFNSCWVWKKSNYNQFSFAFSEQQRLVSWFSEANWRRTTCRLLWWKLMMQSEKLGKVGA